MLTGLPGQHGEPTTPPLPWLGDGEASTNRHTSATVATRTGAIEPARSVKTGVMMRLAARRQYGVTASRVLRSWRINSASVVCNRAPSSWAVAAANPSANDVGSLATRRAIASSG